jgi:uncharacterized protein YjbJ (UPF0337 family)
VRPRRTIPPLPLRVEGLAAPKSGSYDVGRVGTYAEPGSRTHRVAARERRQSSPSVGTVMGRSPFGRAQRRKSGATSPPETPGVHCGLNRRGRGVRRVVKAKGKVKEGAGKVSGNNKLQAKGKADQTKGNLKQAGEKVKDAFKK